MSKLFYPALFHQAEEGGYWISFPDFPECLTQGENKEEAYEMAVDALGLCVTDLVREGATIPQPSRPYEIVQNSDTVLVVVEFDIS